MNLSGLCNAIENTGQNIVSGILRTDGATFSSLVLVIIIIYLYLITVFPCSVAWANMKDMFLQDLYGDQFETTEF